MADRRKPASEQKPINLPPPRARFTRTTSDQWYGENAFQKVKGPEVLACPKCTCTWLQQIEVQQYPKRHHVILGQQVAPVSDIAFVILKCPKCSELIEPNVQVSGRDIVSKNYDEFLDEIEGPLTPQGEDI
jgi:uncharacterized C2H2 Zn-finger protein